MAMPTIRSAYSAVSWPDSWRQSRLRNESMFTAPYVDRRGLTRNWEEFSALSGRAQDVVGLNARRRMAGRLHNPKLGLQPVHDASCGNTDGRSTPAPATIRIALRVPEPRLFVA